MGILAESIVGRHLIRLAFNISKQKQLFNYENVLFYWKSKKHREVDFVIKLNNNIVIPIEVKYQLNITKNDRFGIIDFQKNSRSKIGILLSKDSMEIKGEIIILPIWLFLILI